MLLAETVNQVYVLDLSAYPRWLIVLAGTLAAVVVLWILMKVLKWALWVLIIVVFLGGLAWSGWELMR